MQRNANNKKKDDDIYALFPIVNETPLQDLNNQQALPRKNFATYFPDLYHETIKYYPNGDWINLYKFVQLVSKQNLFKDVLLLFDPNPKAADIYKKFLIFIFSNKENKELLTFFFRMVIMPQFNNLDGKLDANKKDVKGNTLLDWSIFCSQEEHVIENIIYTRPHAKTEDLIKPLIIASYCNNEQIVTLLLMHGAPVNGIIHEIGFDKDKLNNVSALDIAFKFNQLQIAILLLSYHAKIRTDILNGQSGDCVYALLKQLIIDNEYEFFLNLLTNMTDCKPLLKKFGTQFLSIAVAKNLEEFVTLLHTKGADINGEFENKYEEERPIIEACKHPMPVLLNYLLRFDANVNVYSKKGQTPFSIAVENANPSLLKALLEKGGDKIDERNRIWLLDRAKVLFESITDPKNIEMHDKRLKVLHMIASLSFKNYGVVMSSQHSRQGLFTKTLIRSQKEVDAAAFAAKFLMNESDRNLQKEMSKYKKTLTHEGEGLSELSKKAHLSDRLKRPTL